MHVLLSHRLYRLSPGCEKKTALRDSHAGPTLLGAVRSLQRCARLMGFECGMVLLCAVVCVQTWCRRPRLSPSVPPPFRLAERLNGGL